MNWSEFIVELPEATFWGAVIVALITTVSTFPTLYIQYKARKENNEYLKENNQTLSAHQLKSTEDHNKLSTNLMAGNNGLSQKLIEGNNALSQKLMEGNNALSKELLTSNVNLVNKIQEVNAIVIQDKIASEKSYQSLDGSQKEIKDSLTTLSGFMAEVEKVNAKNKDLSHENIRLKELLDVEKIRSEELKKHVETLSTDKNRLINENISLKNKNLARTINRDDDFEMEL